MIATITMSVRHPFGSVFFFLVVYAKHGSTLWKIARLVWNSARLVWKSARFLQQLLWENFFLLRVFWGALRGLGGRLSQFCGTVAIFRFNDYTQGGAERDEVVELQPSFEHLPPVLSSSRVFQWQCARC